MYVLYLVYILPVMSAQVMSGILEELEDVPQSVMDAVQVALHHARDKPCVLR